MRKLSLLKILISDRKFMLFRVAYYLKCKRARKLWQDDHDEDEQLKNNSN